MPRGSNVADDLRALLAQTVVEEHSIETDPAGKKFVDGVTFIFLPEKVSGAAVATILRGPNRAKVEKRLRSASFGTSVEWDGEIRIELDGIGGRRSPAIWTGYVAEVPR